MNDSVTLASYLLSPSSKFTNPEHTSQFKLIRDPYSNRINDFMKNETILIALYIHLLTLQDTDKISNWKEIF